MRRCVREVRYGVGQPVRSRVSGGFVSPMWSAHSSTNATQTSHAQSAESALRTLIGMTSPWRIVGRGSCSSGASPLHFHAFFFDALACSEAKYLTIWQRLTTAALNLEMVASRSSTHDCQSGNSCGSLWLSALRWIFCSIWSHKSASVSCPGAAMSENHLSGMFRSSRRQRNKAPASRRLSGDADVCAGGVGYQPSR